MRVQLAAIVAMLGGVGAACGGDGPKYAEDHPRIYLAANRERLAGDLAAGGPAAQRFLAAADRFASGSDIWGYPAWHAALAGQLTGAAKYCRAAITAIDDQVTDAEAAVSAGMRPEVADDSYLHVGPMIGDLALVYDWCFDAIDESRRAHWLAYAQQAVWNVWNPDQAKWGSKTMPWSGWATDDPANNYHYSFLRATMLLGLAAHGEVPSADALLSQFRDQLLEGQLFPTFNSDLEGGGSREGTGYGTSLRGLFELYDVWKASTGEDLAAKTGHTRASMLAMMHSIVPTLDRVAPTGDHSRDSEALLFDYHRGYLQTLIALFPRDPASGRAQSLLAASSVPEMENQFMVAYDFIYANRGVMPRPLSEVGTAYHAPGTGQLYVRGSWERDATWWNLLAGPYTQSHAHQDQGSLLLYKGAWLVYDGNVDSKSGLHQEPEAHSLVRIVDGGKTVAQRAGTTSKLVALQRGTGWLHAAADVTAAYKGAAAVQKVQREVVFLEPDALLVYDRVVTRAGGQQVWQLVTPKQPAISGSRATIPGPSPLTVERVAPAQAFAARTLSSVDSDFTAGHRLEVAVPGGDQRYLHVLWTGGAVSAVTGEPEGATLQLAGGRTARVVFSRDGVGGTLTLDGATVQLGATVASLPE
jgi:hypothetical protein